MFDDLNRYEATTHFNGQSTVALNGDRATGESYCLAHHLYTEDGERKLMVASLRYLDTFVKTDGTWLFAERKLYVDWTETRSSHPLAPVPRSRPAQSSPTPSSRRYFWLVDRLLLLLAPDLQLCGLRVGESALGAKVIRALTATFPVRRSLCLASFER